MAYGRTLDDSDAQIRQSPHYRALVGYPVEKVITRFTKRIGLNDIGNVSSLRLHQQNDVEQASVLNFHNLHSDYFSYFALPKLTAEKAAVWTFHDMWAFTGHCAYSNDCRKWQTGCGSCPYPGELPAIRHDATHWEWKLKHWVYDRSKFTIVAPSRWLAHLAEQSMMNRFQVHHIPYGIDTDIYRPLDYEICRQELGLPRNKHVILFGAQILKDVRKGGDLLLKALEHLPSSLKAETILLTLGSGGKELAKSVGMETLDLGYVREDERKAISFSAADLFVFPTRADNLPLVLQESIACGTPMVSFRVGGVPDIVRPGVTGYLAEPEDAIDLSAGIVKLLEDEPLRIQMRQNCRTIALEEYTLERQASRYLELYQHLLQN
jgi:glycosyltransferase involved in cell wall biosynthesis